MEATVLTSISEQEFEKLVSDHESQIFYLALQLAGDIESAERVMAETFICYHAQHRASADTTEINKALCKIAVEIARNLCEVSEPYRLPIEMLAGDSGKVSEGERRMLLEYAVNRLPWEYKSVFALSDVIRLSAEDIADILVLTTSEVRSRLHRARLLISRNIDSVIAKTDLSSVPMIESETENRSELLR